MIAALIITFLIVATDNYITYKKGYPLLSILIAHLKQSKNFKFLACNLWGNDDRFYNKVYRKTSNYRNIGE